MKWIDYRKAKSFEFDNPLASFTEALSNASDAAHDTKWNDRLTFNIPLWPDFVGRSVWKAGDFWKKQNYFLCAIELILEGDLEIIERDKSTIVAPGQIYLIHCGEDSIMQTGPSNFCYKIAVGFRGPLLFPLLISTGLIEKTAYGLVDQKAVYSRIQSLERLLLEQDENKISQICALSVELFTFLRCDESMNLDPRLSETLLLMESNLAQKINIAKLASAMNISIATMNRLFQRHFGKSAERYWNDLKMQRAALQLRNSQLSIKEVAQRVGYSDQLHFSHRFKKFSGMSPTDFRRQNPNNMPAMWPIPAAKKN